MDQARKLELLAEILDADAQSLTEDQLLTEAGEWDSLATLSFVVMMSDEFGREVSREEARSLQTVGDALRMMG